MRKKRQKPKKRIVRPSCNQRDVMAQIARVLGDRHYYIFGEAVYGPHHYVGFVAVLKDASLGGDSSNPLLVQAGVGGVVRACPFFDPSLYDEPKVHDALFPELRRRFGKKIEIGDQWDSHNRKPWCSHVPISELKEWVQQSNHSVPRVVYEWIESRAA